jgi:Zn-dependent peptidase ImmA (M78 family)
MSCVNTFIARNRLHKSGVPVSLHHTKEDYEIHYVPLAQRVYGIACFADGVKFIAVNNRKDAYTQHMVAAHEIAHHLLRHSNGLFICREHDWFYRHMEVHANLAAAKILIPEDLLGTHLAAGLTLNELQHVFQVPPQLIGFYINKSQILSGLESGMNATGEIAVGW